MNFRNLERCPCRFTRRCQIRRPSYRLEIRFRGFRCSRFFDRHLDRRDIVNHRHMNRRGNVLLRRFDFARFPARSQASQAATPLCESLPADFRKALSFWRRSDFPAAGSIHAASQQESSVDVLPLFSVRSCAACTSASVFSNTRNRRSSRDTAAALPSPFSGSFGESFVEDLAQVVLVTITFGIRRTQSKWYRTQGLFDCVSDRRYWLLRFQRFDDFQRLHIFDFIDRIVANLCACRRRAGQRQNLCADRVAPRRRVFRNRFFRFAAHLPRHDRKVVGNYRLHQLFLAAEISVSPSRARSLLPARRRQA